MTLKLFYLMTWILKTFNNKKVKSFNLERTYYVPGIGIDAYINFLIQPKLWTGIVDAFFQCEHWGLARPGSLPKVTWGMRGVGFKPPPGSMAMCTSLEFLQPCAMGLPLPTSVQWEAAGQCIGACGLGGPLLPVGKSQNPTQLPGMETLASWMSCQGVRWMAVYNPRSQNAECSLA